MGSGDVTTGATPAVISVLTDARRADPEVLAETAEALLRQTLGAWEWIVAGGEGSLGADGLGDGHVRPLRADAGAIEGAVRNAALDAASAEVVVVLDSADRLERTALETWAWLMTTQPGVALADGVVAADDGWLAAAGGIAAGARRT